MKNKIRLIWNVRVYSIILHSRKSLFSPCFTDADQAVNVLAFFCLSQCSLCCWNCRHASRRLIADQVIATRFVSDNLYVVTIFSTWGQVVLPGTQLIVWKLRYISPFANISSFELHKWRCWHFPPASCSEWLPCDHTYRCLCFIDRVLKQGLTTFNSIDKTFLLMRWMLVWSTYIRF